MSAEARRTRILDATETLLVEIGNGALTMRKIAAAAEISLGNLQSSQNTPMGHLTYSSTCHLGHLTFWVKRPKSDLLETNMRRTQ